VPGATPTVSDVADEPADLETFGAAQPPTEIPAPLVHRAASTRSVVTRLLVVDVAFFT
jgi:hypothetical protein